ncbi:hypothetical protein LCGC14_2702400 [marine sediment metagenome]|uniref:Uncharacterized protein n=1 Tax=marine sediment metagenome TaxID=412755 RepID=A0A0F9C7A2_9ZZZZ
MPAYSEEPPKSGKSKSGGLTAIIDAKVIAAMKKKARKDAAERKQKTFPLRRIMGALALGMWMMFLTAEFFNVVTHVETLGHDFTKWSPLFVGLLLLAPDAFDRLVVFAGRLKGLKVSLPPKEEDPPK